MKNVLPVKPDVHAEPIVNVLQPERLACAELAAKFATVSRAETASVQKVHVLAQPRAETATAAEIATVPPAVEPAFVLAALVTAAETASVLLMDPNVLALLLSPRPAAVVEKPLLKSLKHENLVAERCRP